MSLVEIQSTQEPNGAAQVCTATDLALWRQLNSTPAPYLITA